MGFFGGGGSAASNMVGATSSDAGTAGLVPAPSSGSQRKFLRGDATFQSIADQVVPTTPTRRSGYISFFGSGGSFGARGTSTGYVLCGHIYIPDTKGYSTYTIYVTQAGSAGSVGKLAIYSISSSAEPNSLICQSGTFTTDSTGTKQPTMTSVVINSGWYFVLVGTDSSTTVNFRGEANSFARSLIYGANSSSAEGIDYSTKAYADLWPDPWNGTNVFSNAFHFMCELT
jgi:hypothetical protein